MSTELIDETGLGTGISIGDASVIKQSILHLVKEAGAGETGTAYSLAKDLIAAFEAIDDAAFRFSKREAEAKKANGGYFASDVDKSQAKLTTDG